VSFQTAFITSAGGRNLNEDAYGCVEANGTLCCIVADGLGGQHGGETASRLAVATVIAGFHSDSSCEVERVDALLHAANDAIAEQQTAAPQLSAMRSTVVLLLVDLNYAVWGYVGDSRLYRFEQGRLVFQTKDHSVPQALCDAGKIQASDIRLQEDRNRLLRSLGSNDGLRATLSTGKHKLGPSDSFLLCTDGFWEHLTETEMEVEFSKSSSADEWLQRMSTRIARQVQPDHDNYSAVAVWRER